MQSELPVRLVSIMYTGLLSELAKPWSYESPEVQLFQPIPLDIVETINKDKCNLTSHGFIVLRNHGIDTWWLLINSLIELEDK